MKRLKLGNILSTVSIVCIFLVVGIFVLSTMGTLKLTTPVIDFLLIVGIICFGCISCSSAARLLENNKKNIWGYIILATTAITCVLWIIFVFAGQDFILTLIKTGEVKDIASIWGLAKATIICTIVTSFMNLVITYVTTFKTQMIAFQCIMYASNFVFEGWLILLMLSVGVKNGEFNMPNEFLISKTMITIAVLAFAFACVSGIIIKSISKRRGRQIGLDAISQKINTSATETLTVEERIKKLQTLKSQGLITEEDYNKQKENILKEL